MIRPRDRQKAGWFETQLVDFSRNDIRMPGVDTTARRQTFIAQLIESTRRIELINCLRNRPISIACADPHNAAFNPLKAAILQVQQGQRDEAYWLVFLLTHFSKHQRQGWALTRAVYGKLGETPFWSWKELCTEPTAFRTWLKQNQSRLHGLSFGNHRKYEFDPRRQRTWASKRGRGLRQLDFAATNTR